MRLIVFHRFDRCHRLHRQCISWNFHDADHQTQRISSFIRRCDTIEDAKNELQCGLYLIVNGKDDEEKIAMRKSEQKPIVNWCFAVSESTTEQVSIERSNTKKSRAQTVRIFSAQRFFYAVE